jgi:hypothetical protein
MTDRRTHVRIPLGTFMTAIAGDRPALCLATDISSTGVHLRASNRVSHDDDTPVVMRFSLPGDPTMLWACGRVVRRKDRSRASDLGVQFTYLPENTRRRLDALAQN